MFCSLAPPRDTFRKSFWLETIYRVWAEKIEQNRKIKNFDFGFFSIFSVFCFCNFSKIATSQSTLKNHFIIISFTIKVKTSLSLFLPWLDLLSKPKKVWNRKIKWLTGLHRIKYLWQCRLLACSFQISLVSLGKWNAFIPE